MECIQKKVTKLVQGLENKTNKEWLTKLGLLSLEMKSLGGTLSLCSYLREGYCEVGAHLFSWVTTKRT